MHFCKQLQPSSCAYFPCFFSFFFLSPSPSFIYITPFFLFSSFPWGKENKQKIQQSKDLKASINLRMVAVRSLCFSVFLFFFALSLTRSGEKRS